MYKQLLLNFVFYVISIACIQEYGLSFGNLEALLSFVAPPWFCRIDLITYEK